jgi:hypothetical protein
MATLTPYYYQAMRRARITVNAGETTPWYPVNPIGESVVVSPGSGGTMRVERTQSPPDYYLADNANSTSTCIAIPWPSGDVSVITEEDLNHTTAVRFIATTTAGIAEIAE